MSEISELNDINIQDEQRESLKIWAKKGLGVYDDVIHFMVEGNPTAKGRHRAYADKSGQIRTYTPMKTAAWENYIRMVARTHAPRELLEGPLSLQIYFYMPIPGSWSKKKKTLARMLKTWPTVKPDLDNMVKLVKDALNGIIWHDDKQVVYSRASKMYSDKPRTDIFVGKI